MPNNKFIRGEQILMELGRGKLLEQIDVLFNALNDLKDEFGVKSTTPYIAKAMGYNEFENGLFMKAIDDDIEK